jgi:hypothetical protein
VRRSLATIGIAAIAALFGAGVAATSKASSADEDPPPPVRQLTPADHARLEAAQAKRDRKAAKRLSERR